MKDSAAFKALKCAALLLAAEIIASGSIWCGTPTDWIGEPLHFWSYEIPRLPYWALFFLASTLVWFAGRQIIPGSIPPIVTRALRGILAIGVEVSTSAFCWWRFRWTETNCQGLTYFPDYFWGHLISWVVVVALGLIASYFWNKKRRTPRDTPMTR